ncbi:hypothetical protein ACS0TY_012802 [Phlomoides rotata]
MKNREFMYNSTNSCTIVDKFSRFSLGYLEREEWTLPSEARFEGHQTLKDREKPYHATNQTIHCGFVSGPDGFPSM